MDNTTLPYFASLATADYVKFTWHGNPMDAIGVAVNATRTLAGLFRVERYTVTTATWDEWGERGPVGYRPAGLDELSAVADLVGVTAQDGVRLRIAIPNGAATELPWVIVDPDQRVRQAGFTPAEAVGECATGWLDPRTPIGPGFTVEITEPGTVEVTCRGGLFALDLRPIETAVHGVPLAAWIDAEHELRTHVLQESGMAGFSRP